MFNPFRLLTKYSVNDSCENLNKNKKFFCSELVASIYKVMGVLPKNICSAQYWPGSFSCESNIDLINNCSLSEEYYISFDPDIPSSKPLK